MPSSCCGCCWPPAAVRRSVWSANTGRAPRGLRTFALVAAGAAAFVLFGEQAGAPAAPLQITAYVVSGIGFLGGGVILRQGFSVQGLNTAATLWCSAAVGAQAAGGHVLPALALTGIVLAIHAVLRPLGRLLDKVPAVTTESVAVYDVLVEVGRKHEPQLRAQLLQALTTPAVTVRGGVAGRTVEDDTDGSSTAVQLRAQIEVEGTPNALLDGLVNRLSLEPGVRSISWHADDSDDELDDHLWGWRRLRWRRASGRDD